MVALVEQMLELHKQLAAAKTEHDQIALKRQIDTTDNQIDQLMYELYGLTEEEKKIVEGKEKCQSVVPSRAQERDVTLQAKKKSN